MSGDSSIAVIDHQKHIWHILLILLVHSADFWKSYPAAYPVFVSLPNL